MLFLNKLNPLSATQLMIMLQGAKIQTQDSYGPKVYRLQDERYLKLFRNKHYLSSTRYYPIAKRFYNNTLKLTEHNIKTVHCEGYFIIPSLKRTAIIYQALAGEKLRVTPQRWSIEAFAIFFATLHEQGIYFRSCHLANLLVLEKSEQFGLIDVADIKFLSKPLSLRKRFRNFKHLFRYPEDRQQLNLAMQTTFWKNYFMKSSLLKNEQNKLQKAVISLC